MADRDTRLEDVSQGEAERTQRISAAEAELLALKESRLFRLHRALAELRRRGKLTHLGHFAASLPSVTRIRRGVAQIGRGSHTAIPMGREERFDPDLYRELYPDIDASGSDPHEHYAVFGRREGRIGWLETTTLDLSGLDKSRPTALVVFPEGSQTRASIVGYNIVLRLLRHTNTVAFFYTQGPVMTACQEAGAVVVGPEVWRGAPQPLPPNLFRRFIEQIAPQFAIVSGVESRHIARSLADLYVPTVTLIHDFAAARHPRGAMTDAAFWSGATVFSAEIARDNVWASEFGLSGIDFPVEATFDMDQYVARLENIVELQRSQAEQERRDSDRIVGSELIQADFVRPIQQISEPYADTARRYVRAWSSGIHRRKPFPGFHPGIYLEEHGVQRPGADPLVDYINAGRPHGPWAFDLVTPSGSPPAVPEGLRIALHIHVHYADLLGAMVERLAYNKTRVDLLVSATSDQAHKEASSQLASYRGGSVDVRLVPNRGRDLAPLLTEFADTIVNGYDIIGHVHTKKTAEMNDTTIGAEWYRFLLENLIGGRARMADETLARMADDPLVGMVFPDDPHVVGWTQNRGGAEALSLRLKLGRVPENLVFPVGSMFWARVPALRSLFGLGLRWEDYPQEPVPYDGTILHAIERLLPMVATASGGSILLTHVPGVTR